MADTAGIPWGDIGSSLLSEVKTQIEARAKGFFETHKDQEAFLVQCTERLAKAMFFYTIAADDATKADRKAQMDALKDAIREESLAITVDLESEAKSTFLTVLETAISVAVKVAPLLLAAV
jgi:hypothetical protein